MKKKQLVIVEDEMIIAEDISRTLQSSGYEVIDIVDTGKLAIEATEKHHPDLIIMDINLKGDMNGIKAAQIIRERFDIPMIYLTANADLATFQQAKLAQPFGYIIKPYQRRELYATIEMAFYKHEMELKLKESKNKIKLLHNVTRKLSQSKTHQKVYDITISAANYILDFAICALDILEDDYFIVKATSCEQAKKDTKKIKMDEGLVGKTFKLNKTIIKNDLENDKEFPLENKKYKSIISSPIKDVGVFQAVANEKNAFTNEDAELLELLLGHTKEAIKRINLQQKLEKLAIYDSLTGVYNRHFMEETLSREVKQSKRYHRNIAFIMIDLNDLKEINDKYGHKTGDEVIKIVSRILKNEARETDIIVRFGGDEFLIILPETSNEVFKIKERYIKAMEKWNKKNDKYPFNVSFSVGSAYWAPNKYDDVDKVIEKADQKMYHHKTIYKKKK